MSKNIIICCDGTNNQFDGDHTNVIRTYKVAGRSARQMTFYDCGVGTMPEPWAGGKLAKRWSLLKGLAFGSGFMQNIEDAYRFLMATEGCKWLHRRIAAPQKMNNSGDSSPAWPA
jgi:uncharacterized protein (DUF2235 family)